MVLAVGQNPSCRRKRARGCRVRFRRQTSGLTGSARDARTSAASPPTGILPPELSTHHNNAPIKEEEERVRGCGRGPRQFGFRWGRATLSISSELGLDSADTRAMTPPHRFERVVGRLHVSLEAKLRGSPPSVSRGSTRKDSGRGWLPPTPPRARRADRAAGLWPSNAAPIHRRSGAGAEWMAPIWRSLSEGKGGAQARRFL